MFRLPVLNVTRFESKAYIGYRMCRLVIHVQFNAAFTLGRRMFKREAPATRDERVRIFFFFFELLAKVQLVLIV